MAEPKTRRCELSEEGRRHFRKRAERCATGVIIGELRPGRTCYNVLFDDLKTTSPYHKDFITILKEENAQR